MSELGAQVFLYIVPNGAQLFSTELILKNFNPDDFGFDEIWNPTRKRFPCINATLLEYFLNASGIMDSEREYIKEYIWKWQRDKSIRGGLLIC